MNDNQAGSVAIATSYVATGPPHVCGDDSYRSAFGETYWVQELRLCAHNRSTCKSLGHVDIGFDSGDGMSTRCGRCYHEVPVAEVRAEWPQR